MPRINTVAKAQKDQGTCSGCGKEIKAGDPYKWIKFRFGGRKVKCGACDFRDSELTQSEFLSQVYDLNTRLGNLSGDEPEDLKSELEDIASEFENLASECDDKLSNMPEGFQQGDVGQRLEERSSACNDVASSLQGIDCDFDENEAKEEIKAELNENGKHTKDLTEEVLTELKQDAEKSSVDFEPLKAEYVSQGISQEEYDALVEEKLTEKKSERCQEIIDEAQGTTYDGE